MIQIVRAEAGPFGELGVDEQMGTIEPVRYNVFAAHRSVLDAFIPNSLLSVRLLLLVGRGHTRDRDFHRQNPFNRQGKGCLHRPPHLAGVDAGTHHGTEGTHVEEIFAHEAGDLLRLSVILRVQLGILVDLLVALAYGAVCLPMPFIQHGSFLHIDAIAGLTPFSELGVVTNFALQRDIGDKTMIRLRIDARQVARVGITVGVAIGNIEQEDNVVPTRQCGHLVAPRHTAAEHEVESSGIHQV